MSFQYPISMSFKIVALAPQIYVRDASGQNLMYVKQKLFKFKEQVHVFSDDSKANELYQINADRVIDFSAKYHFTKGAAQSPLGAVRRKGVRSLWKAEYEIFNAADQHTHMINEDNALVRVADTLFTSIPLVGMFSGYVFHPSYTVSEAGSGKPVMQLKKEPAFFEGKFTINKLDQALDSETEERILLCFMMMTLLERARG